MVSRDLYTCRECGNIGDKFSLYFTLHLPSKLEENKQRFVDHWNKEHINSLLPPIASEMDVVYSRLKQLQCVCMDRHTITAQYGQDMTG